MLRQLFLVPIVERMVIHNLYASRNKVFQKIYENKGTRNIPKKGSAHIATRMNIPLMFATRSTNIP